MVRGSISLKVFPAVRLVGLGGREAVAESNRESVQGRLPPHRPPGPPVPVQPLELPVAAGRHEVFLKISWCRSSVVEIDAQAGEVIRLFCAPGEAPAST